MSEQAKTPHADEVETEAEGGAPMEAAEDSHVEPIETGADAVVAALKTAGVEYLFGVQGGAIMPVYDALYSESDMTHVTMAHEQGAAHAADA
ncbi:MAG: thiamine pyrophosphate-binding protein, partial [Haloarculaceae archaeon]